jgi:hypothetical protein
VARPWAWHQLMIGTRPPACPSPQRRQGPLTSRHTGPAFTKQSALVGIIGRCFLREPRSPAPLSACSPPLPSAGVSRGPLSRWSRRRCGSYRKAWISPPRASRKRTKSADGGCASKNSGSPNSIANIAAIRSNASAVTKAPAPRPSVTMTKFSGCPHRTQDGVDQAAARRNRSLIAAPIPSSGIGATAMVAWGAEAARWSAA